MAREIVNIPLNLKIASEREIFEALQALPKGTRAKKMKEALRAYLVDAHVTTPRRRVEDGHHGTAHHAAPPSHHLSAAASTAKPHAPIHNDKPAGNEVRTHHAVQPVSDMTVSVQEAQEDHDGFLQGLASMVH